MSRSIASATTASSAASAASSAVWPCRRAQRDDIQAHYEDGILTVTVPKAEEEKPKRIEVKAKKTVQAEGGDDRA